MNPPEPRPHGRRYQNHEVRAMRLRELPADLQHCDTPEEAFQYWQANITTAAWYNPEVECFCVVHLNTRMRATGFHLVATGTQDTVLTHPREVFRAAIVASAWKILLAHNHPSGNPTASEADIKVTRDLIRAGQLLRIEVLDHVIIGRASTDHPKPFSSLRELGFFYAA